MHLVGVVFVSFLMSFTLISCDIFNADDYKYSPYMINKAQVWGSKDKAEAAPKFGGTIEVSQYVSQGRNDFQQQSADELYEKTLENVKAKGWFDINKAMEAGYVYEPEKDFTHYPNYNFLFDNEELNPEKPEYLMFYQTGKGKVLAGVMYMVEDLYAHGQQVGGQETVWHYHDYGEEGRCDTFFKLPPDHKYASQVDTEKCEEGFFVNRSPEMMHVWFVNHPEGRFATSMVIPESLLVESPFYESVNQGIE